MDDLGGTPILGNLYNNHGTKEMPETIINQPFGNGFYQPIHLVISRILDKYKINGISPL